MQTCEEIVRRLAEVGHTCCEDERCLACNQTDCAPDCIYRAAREWVAANPLRQEGVRAKGKAAPLALAKDRWKRP
jgi:hypothetical protein